MFIQKEKIKNVIKNTSYQKYLNEIHEIIKTHHKNFQCLLTSKALFRKISFYGKKKNKFFYEHINENKFNILLTKILNNFYEKYNFLKNEQQLFLRLFDVQDSVVNELNKKGISIFNELLAKPKCQKIIDLLNLKQFHNRQTNEIKKLNLYGSNKNIWWLHNYQDLLQIDLVQHILSSSYLLHIAQTYFGCTPILHHVHFWASYPGDLESTQKFHQDFDDIRFLKVFIYLNDVSELNGPHCYVQKSLQNAHNIIKKDNKLSERLEDDLVNDYFKEDVLHIKGNTGTMIIEDTHGIHKGAKVKEGKRFIFQLLFGCSTFYTLKMEHFKKYKCSIEKHAILYQAFKNYPYTFMNFNFEK